MGQVLSTESATLVRAEPVCWRRREKKEWAVRTRTHRTRFPIVPRVFTVAGSLVLGFLDLQAGQAQNRFYNELEDWLSGITELQLGETLASGSTPQLRYAMLEMQRSISILGSNIEKDTLQDNSAEAVRGLAAGVEKMIEQMRAEQKIVREWADEQAELQRDMASIIKDITENADKKSAPRTKSGPKGGSR